MNNCTLCDTINATERELDIKAEALTNRVMEILRPTIEHNNKKWEKFAQYCRIPLIGEGVFLIFNSPSLKDTFSYWNEKWFNETGRTIEKEATSLEYLKQKDLAHWGNELVTPYLGDDPAAYYYPSHKLRRKDCLDTAYVQFMKEKCSSNLDSFTQISPYDTQTREITNIETHIEKLDREFKRYLENNTIRNTETYDVWLPEKYCFTSGGYDKLHAESKVMDFATKNIVPKNQCDSLATNGKVFFSIRPMYKVSA